MGYDITLTDGTSERLDDADGYALEGPLTTFFRCEPGRPARLDAWAVRILSVRTDRVLRVCCVEAASSPRLAIAG